MHEWLVTFRNDKMGFIKTITFAPKDSSYSNYLSAANEGSGILRAMGYDPTDFAIVKIERGKEHSGNPLVRY